MAPRKKRAASDDFDSVSDFEPEASPDVSEAGSDPGSSDYDEAPKRGAPKRKAPAKKANAANASDGAAGGSGKKKPAAQKPVKITAVTTLPDGWTLHPPSLLYKLDEAAQGGTKIACFDLDGTLIAVRSGSQFPRDADDWKFFNKEVPTKLRQLAAEGYQIWVCSNQNGVKGALAGKMSEKVRRRFDNMMAALNSGDQHAPVHIQPIMATQQDVYRKPERNMWDFLVEHANKGVQPDLSQCFYCGDMAGREADHSQSKSDLQFAQTVGIDFFTPEDKFGEADLTAGADPSVLSTGPNAGMAQAFRQLAALNEGFKRNAFNNVATVIDAFEDKIKSAKDLQAIKGVGKSSLAKITEFLETGTLAALTEAGVTGGDGGGGAPVDKAGEVGLKFL